MRKMEPGSTKAHDGVTSPETRTFFVPEAFRPYLDETVLALGYRSDMPKISKSGDGLEYTSAEDLSKEISYALVRVKVRVDGQKQRTALFRSVFGS